MKIARTFSSLVILMRVKKNPLTNFLFAFIKIIPTFLPLTLFKSTKTLKLCSDRRKTEAFLWFFSCSPWERSQNGCWPRRANFLLLKKLKFKIKKVNKKIKRLITPYQDFFNGITLRCSKCIKSKYTVIYFHKHVFRVKNQKKNCPGNQSGPELQQLPVHGDLCQGQNRSQWRKFHNNALINFFGEGTENGLVHKAGFRWNI